MRTNEETQRRTDWSNLFDPLYETSCHGDEPRKKWADDMADNMVNTIQNGMGSDDDYSRPSGNQAGFI